MSREYPDRPFVGVVAVVRRAGTCLLIQRGREPNLGFWGFPGGAQELGETIIEAALRELAEETGVDAEAPRILDAFDAIETDEAGRVRRHFTIVAVGFDWRAGEGQAGDDAAATGWFSPQSLHAIRVLPRVAPLMALVL